MERQINLIAGFASIVSLVLTAIPAIFSGTVSAYVQSLLAFICVLILILIYVWLRKYTPNRTSTIPKEQLVKVARQHIDSASNKIVLFSNDLSWVSDYADSLRARIQANCEVVVLHRQSTIPRVKQNAQFLQQMGATVIELVEDHRIRATLIDPDDPDTARLFVAHKRRREGSATAIESGQAGTDKDFDYECAVYQGGADKVLTRALARLATHGFPLPLKA